MLLVTREEATLRNSGQNTAGALMGHSGEAATFEKDLHVATLLTNDVTLSHARSFSGRLKMCTIWEEVKLYELCIDYWLDGYVM